MSLDSAHQDLTDSKDTIEVGSKNVDYYIRTYKKGLMDLHLYINTDGKFDQINLLKTVYKQFLIVIDMMTLEYLDNFT